MPTVPSYGGPRQELSPENTQRQQGGYTGRELDGGMADAAQRGIGVAAGVYAQQRKQAQQARMDDARLQYEERLTPELAAWNQRTGVEAQRSIDDLETVHSKIVGDLTADMDDEAAQEFSNWASGRRVEVNRSLTFRAASEMKRHEAQVFESNGKLTLERIKGAALDPMVLGKALSERREEIRRFQERNGLPPEWEKEVGEAETSRAVRALIEQHMSDGNDILARETLERYGNYLSVNDSAAMNRAVKASSSQAEAFRIGDDIYRRIQSGELDKSQVLAEVKSMAGDDVQVRAQAEQRALWLVARDEEYQREKVSDWTTEAHTVLLQTNGDMEQVPPDVRRQLLTEAPDNYQKLMAIAGRLSSGVETQTSMATWTGIVDMIATRPNDLAQMSAGDLLVNYRESLSESDYRKLLDVWRGMRQDASAAEKAKGQEAFSGIRTENQMMTAALRNLNIDPNNMNENEEAIVRMMDSEIAAKKIALGRDKLTPEEVTEALDTVVANIRKSWGGRQLTEAGKSIVYRVEDIPESRMPAIRAAAQGRITTDRRIMDAYNRMAKDGKLADLDEWILNQEQGGGPTR